MGRAVSWDNQKENVVPPPLLRVNPLCRMDYPPVGGSNAGPSERRETTSSQAGWATGTGVVPNPAQKLFLRPRCRGLCALGHGHYRDFSLLEQTEGSF